MPHNQEVEPPVFKYDKFHFENDLPPENRMLQRIEFIWISPEDHLHTRYQVHDTKLLRGRRIIKLCVHEQVLVVITKMTLFF